MSNKMNNYSGGGGGRQEKNVNYIRSNRNPSHGQEDKRPSVFDRLGVRRDVGGGSGSYSSHGHPDRQEGQSFKRLDHGKANMRQGNPSSAGANSQVSSSEKKRPYNRERDAYRGRSPSSSPKRKGASAVPHNKRKIKAKSTSSYQSDSNVSRSKHSNFTPRGGTSGTEKRKQRSSTKSKGKDKKNKKNKKSKSNNRSSSISSDDSSSGGNSSSSGSSGSQSSSSTYSESSSSSSADSSSDSSVPSVKLKPERKSKSKKKSKDKGKGKIDKPVKKPVVSSSSSVDPHDDNPKGQQWIHRRDKLGSKDIISPVQDDKMNMNRDIRKDRYQRDYPEDSRKRKLSGGGYEADFKRSRLTPPQNKCKTAPMRSLSPRRAPPAPGTPNAKMKPDEGVLPVGRERIRLLHTPPRRPMYEEPRKVELPKDKPISSNNLVRARDMNYDSIQHSSRPQNTERYGYDKPGYKKEEIRPRERIAPVRNQGPTRRGRMTPESERDRIKDMPKDFEMRPKGPLLSTPFLPPTHERNKPGGMLMRQHMDDDRRMNMKPFPNEPFRRHSPLLVKTKEELSEKYDELKLSRVDMWVDETLKGTSAPVRDMEPEKNYVPKRNILDKRSPVDIKDSKFTTPAPSSINIGEKSKPEIEELGDKEEFSDFSDDADEILNKEVEVKFDDDSPERVEKVDDLSVAKDKIADVAPEPAEKTTKVVSEEIVVVPEKVVEKVAERAEKVAPEPQFIKFREREQKNVASLRSQSQTEDDLFEAMAFEEISDEELGEVENKIGIVDALGVDWASLVCCEKKYGSPDSDVKPSACRVRERWKPLEIIKQTGLSKKYLGEELTATIEKKMAEKGEVEEFGFPKSKKANNNDKVLERLGLGPNSRALSSRRDMATRYCFMEMLPRNLLSIDLFRPTTTTTPAQETD